jgi:hypothetical protein
VASRGLAFSDPEVIRLLSERFIPVAENCSPLQVQPDAKGEFFRKVAEQGHYAGRTVPSATRQGQYACTADGTLLASINARLADKLLGMLREALERWQQRPQAQAEQPGAAQYVPDPRYRTLYPEDGLVLRVVSRDLPRVADSRPQDWRTQAVNYDFAWCTRAELLSLVSPNPQPGQRFPVAWPIVRRLARFHLLDNVRGETPAWKEDEVRAAAMTLEVAGVEPPAVHLRLDGTVLNIACGTWAVRPFGEKYPQSERGYHCRVHGRLTFDRTQEQFTRFDVLAVGDRWGGTEHNCRWDDLAPAPLGIAFELAGRSPQERVPPHANLWDYFGIGR